ncbi:T6SS amidase immunity protein Tai4 family protein, partial [Massilia cavernae]
ERLAAGDAASASRALMEWTLYDADKGADEIDQLVEHFLRKDYRNPVGDAPGQSSKFSLLKCLDLYHSKELNSLVKRIVIRPHSIKR